MRDLFLIIVTSVAVGAGLLGVILGRGERAERLKREAERNARGTSTV